MQILMTMKLKIELFLFHIVILAFVASSTMGQTSIDGRILGINTITTAVPFLTIPIGASMNGDITTVPNGTMEPAIFSNLGLLGFEKKKFGFSFTYTPWFRSYFKDNSISGLGFYYRFNKHSTLGFGLRYFSLGLITYHDIVGNITTQFNPNEFTTSLSYTLNFDENTCLGIGGEFIYSNLTGGYYVGGVETRPGMAIAANLGFSKRIVSKDDRFSHIVGISLDHVGSKITYMKDGHRDFIPITLALGYQFRMDFDRWSISVSYEASKLLVPSPPLYYSDSVDINNNPVIRYGYDTHVSVPLGMIRSFYDAPSGFKEEMNEIIHQVGLRAMAYGFSCGTGFFYESGSKGHRQFFTVGLGYNLKDRLRVNFSYLIPYNNPISLLAKTWRLGLNVMF